MNERASGKGFDECVTYAKTDLSKNHTGQFNKDPFFFVFVVMGPPGWTRAWAHGSGASRAHPNGPLCRRLPFAGFSAIMPLGTAWISATCPPEKINTAFSFLVPSVLGGFICGSAIGAFMYGKHFQAKCSFLHVCLGVGWEFLMQ